MRRFRRPFSALAAAGTAGHHGYELAAGVGLVFQPELGLGGSLTMWGVSIPAWAAIAARGSSRFDAVLAAASGLGLAGVVTHYLLWPTELRRGVPFLTEGEGLTPRQLPVYNAILHGWAAASLLSLLTETPPGKRRWALAGLAVLPGFRVSAAYHFRWAHEQAEKNPAWWNRALQDRPPVAVGR